MRTFCFKFTSEKKKKKHLQLVFVVVNIAMNKLNVYQFVKAPYIFLLFCGIDSHVSGYSEVILFHHLLLHKEKNTLTSPATLLDSKVFVFYLKTKIR